VLVIKSIFYKVLQGEERERRTVRMAKKKKAKKKGKKKAKKKGRKKCCCR